MDSTYLNGVPVLSCERILGLLLESLLTLRQSLVPIEGRRLVYIFLILPWCWYWWRRGTKYNDAQIAGR